MKTINNETTEIETTESAEKQTTTSTTDTKGINVENTTETKIETTQSAEKQKTTTDIKGVKVENTNINQVNVNKVQGIAIVETAKIVSEAVAKTAKNYWSQIQELFSRVNRNGKVKPVAFASKMVMILSFLAAVGIVLASAIPATIALGVPAVSTSVALIFAMRLAVVTFVIASVVLAYFSESEIRVRSRIKAFAFGTIVALVGAFVASWSMTVAIGPLTTITAFAALLAFTTTYLLYFITSLVIVAVGLVRMASTKVNEYFMNENVTTVYGPVEATQVAPVTVKA